MFHMLERVPVKAGARPADDINFWRFARAITLDYIAH